MGPVRRGLTAAAPLAAMLAALLTQATATLAQEAATVTGVCKDERPLWDGTPVSMLGEAVILFSSPAALILLAASAIAVALRSSWGALALCVLWSGLTMLIAAADPTGLRAEAFAEGCRASPALFIVAVAAICGAMILHTSRKPRPAE
ncbi:hypothetical protein SAMN05421666_0460 [Roseovarius nanhaiticus]|uniref:Uncharacterized protein n=1 Tax=Roseovarius nanhaiticus TaxID=573024 RepID=A0A1N7EQY8_9RHOB|nr:hypothetical protein [Roseovarius nanhaiticus]SEK68496.1 hypothetical protein SAMN05216208_1675 [Roseovarius nanhaiticus]SIR90511.1 hypothetical protein SAMN05421666_0460 [Roseovarius nanhaiticus]